MNNFTTKECLFQVTLCLETLTGFDVARLLTPFGQNQCLQAKLIPKKKKIFEPNFVPMKYTFIRNFGYV